MKRAGNFLIYIAILTIVDLFIMASIANVDYRSPHDVENVKQGYKILMIIGLIQIIFLFIAGFSLKNDNTIIRRISEKIVK